MDQHVWCVILTQAKKPASGMILLLFFCANCMTHDKAPQYTAYLCIVKFKKIKQKSAKKNRFNIMCWPRRVRFCIILLMKADFSGASRNTTTWKLKDCATFPRMSFCRIPVHRIFRSPEQPSSPTFGEKQHNQTKGMIHGDFSHDKDFPVNDHTNNFNFEIAHKRIVEYSITQMS